jgi:DNA segregation ATPase FtsK/SpoIIIE-like protein
MAETFEVYPGTNYRFATDAQRTGRMVALGRVLMGCRSRLSIISQCREIQGDWDWTHKPSLERHWYVVGPQAGKLRRYLNGIGLKTVDATEETLTWSKVRPTHVQHNDGYLSQSLVLKRWPREVAPGWLGNALSSDFPVDVGIHIEPENQMAVARVLRRQQDWQEEALSEKPDAMDMLGKEDAEGMRRKLVARTDTAARVAIVFTVYARDRATLDMRVETLRSDVALSLGDARPIHMEHDRGLAATRRTGLCDVVGAWHSLDCLSIASTWIFQPVTINHANGADMGVTDQGEMLVRLDPFDESLRSFGGVVLAKTGEGKSYFISLLAMRLTDVELWVVEQHDPPERAGLANIHTFNLAQYETQAEKVEALKGFIRDLWASCRANPRPVLLILDELWDFMDDEELAALVAEIARRGRKFYLSLWVATQQVADLLQHKYGQAIFNNAQIRVYLKQQGHGADMLASAANLPPEAQLWLESTSIGQALIDDNNGLLVPVDIQASPAEHALITTDPRQRRTAA